MNFDIENLNFNTSGLIPAIAQCSETKDILMLAWMNKESIRLTIETKNVTYFSRSRNKLWVKGETLSLIHISEPTRLLSIGD